MPATDIEQEPRRVDTFVVLDLDRTLLLSDNLTAVLCKAMHQHGVSLEEIEQVNAHIFKQMGTNFSGTAYIKERYGEQMLADVMADTMAAAEAGELEEILLPSGTRELLDLLDETTVPFGVLTFGEEKNQQFKIDLLRAMINRPEDRLPATVTSEPSKSHWMHDTWEQEDGSFMIPVSFTNSQAVVAQQLVTLDDKMVNLLSYDENVRGILINNNENAPRGISIAKLVEALRSGYTLKDLSEHFDAVNALT
jgi:hypothetical protein